jgi:hypothetical protein
LIRSQELNCFAAANTVWAVKASQGMPVGWQDAECEFTLPLSGRWQQQTSELIGHLRKWRDDRSNKLLQATRETRAPEH